MPTVSDGISDSSPEESTTTSIVSTNFSDSIADAIVAVFSTFLDKDGGDVVVSNDHINTSYIC